ncbi:patatin-like phospholipase family protein [Rhodococcus sp. 3Y1]
MRRHPRLRLDRCCPRLGSGRPRLGSPRSHRHHRHVRRSRVRDNARQRSRRRRVGSHATRRARRTSRTPRPHSIGARKNPATSEFGDRQSTTGDASRSSRSEPDERYRTAWWRRPVLAHHARRISCPWRFVAPTSVRVHGIHGLQNRATGRVRGTGAPKATVGEALRASWAIPGWFPPVTIDGVRYIDGGAASTASVDLLLPSNSTSWLYWRPWHLEH